MYYLVLFLLGFLVSTILPGGFASFIILTFVVSVIYGIIKGLNDQKNK